MSNEKHGQNIAEFKLYVPSSESYWYVYSFLEPEVDNPEISITDIQYAERGAKVIIQCNATGLDYPPDEMDWFRNGRHITSQPDQGLEITKQYSLATRKFTSTLVMSRAGPEDDGTYVCRTSDMQITSTRVIMLNGVLTRNIHI